MRLGRGGWWACSRAAGRRQARRFRPFLWSERDLSEIRPSEAVCGLCEGPWRPSMRAYASQNVKVCCGMCVVCVRGRLFPTSTPPSGVSLLRVFRIFRSHASDFARNYERDRDPRAPVLRKTLTDALVLVICYRTHMYHYLGTAHARAPHAAAVAPHRRERSPRRRPTRRGTGRRGRGGGDGRWPPPQVCARA